MPTIDQLKKSAVQIDSSREFREVDLTKTKFIHDKDQKKVTLWMDMGKNDWYALSPIARRRVMNDLMQGAPNFEQSLQKASRESWKEIMQAVQKVSKTKRTIVHINKETSEILGVSGDKGKCTALSTVTKIEELANTNNGWDIREGRINNDGVHVVFGINESKYVPEGGTKKHDIFRNTLFVDHKFGCQPWIGAGLERMWCTNLCYRNETEVWQYILERIPVYVAAQNVLRTIGKIDVTQMQKVNASFNELSLAYNKAEFANEEANKSGRPPVLSDAQLSEMFPLKEVAYKYKINPKKMPPSLWTQTASTPVKAYDLYNNITDLASNVEGLSMKSAMNLRVFGGGLLTRNWDLAQVAPAMSW